MISTGRLRSLLACYIRYYVYAIALLAWSVGNISCANAGQLMRLAGHARTKSSVCEHMHAHIHLNTNVELQDILGQANMVANLTRACTCTSGVPTTAERGIYMCPCKPFGSIHTESSILETILVLTSERTLLSIQRPCRWQQRPQSASDKVQVRTHTYKALALKSDWLYVLQAVCKLAHAQTLPVVPSERIRCDFVVTSNSR
jgi:hypothetical protein